MLGNRRRRSISLAVALLLALCSAANDARSIPDPQAENTEDAP